MRLSIDYFIDVLSYMKNDLNVTEIVMFDTDRDRTIYWDIQDKCHARDISTIRKEMLDKQVEK